jgi:predicted Fe-S protein YdhL (DUF1289 family)
MSEVVSVSPCVNICALDAHGYCLGCYRSIEEIARWASMSDAERSVVLRTLGERRARAPAPALM